MKKILPVLLLLSLAIPAAEAGLLDKLSGLGSSQPKYLDPDKAFSVEVEAQDGRTLVARFKVADGYYLYRKRISFETADPGIKVAKVSLPKGEMKHDPNFGDMVVYHEPFQAVIALERGAGSAQTLHLKAGYQGCSEKGLCYEPMVKALDVSLPALAEAATPPSGSGATPAASFQSPEPSILPQENDNTRIARLFQEGNFWLIISFFFGAGLLLAFTPCVFPMVPILSGIIVGRGHKVTHLHGFLLSFAYVLGMAITYAVAGVAAGYTGTLLSDALQTPWVLGSFAAVFVLLALSMFGLFELQLPAVLQSRLTDASNKLHGGHFAGVFTMGALSALIVGPCVAAPLAGALIYIGKTHDAVLGGTALFSLALGMGAPLLVIGASAGALLPRAGAWMESVKRFFGVLLLAVAIWLITPLIPAVAQMLLWAALLILSSVFLHALDALPPNAGPWRKLWKGMGVIALLVGAAYLVGALSGARDPLHPLAMLGGGRAAATTEGLRFERIKGLEALNARVAQAGGRVVVLDFYADWCVSCKEMERNTFTDPEVRSRLDKALLLQADVTANDPEDHALLTHFNIFGPPAILFFNAHGQERPELRITGYQDPGLFLHSLQQAGL